jgi:hypothetical protein
MKLTSFQIKALTSEGKKALQMFQLNCKGFMVRRVLTVEEVCIEPFSIKVTPNQFISGTLKDKNADTMKKARKIIQEQWLKQYKVIDSIDYEVS